MPSLANFDNGMDQLAVQCKKKLESFRIRELKDVLSKIGVGKQGRKQVLVDKIMAIMLSAERGHFTAMGVGPKSESLGSRNSRSREDVARIIDDIYSVINNENGGNLSNLKRQRTLHGVTNATQSKIQCPCGNQMDFGRMIQCEDPTCFAWQHVNCVVVPEKEDMKPEIPPNFYCELCRIQHGDPFLVSVAHLLMPIKTTASIVYSPEKGASLMQNVEASFNLTDSHQELLQDPHYGLQIWCVLIGDEVKFRMHWPLKAELRVNGHFVRVTNRPGQQKLGTNGRDDGPMVTSIILVLCFITSFCLGVRIVQRLTVDQVLNLVPSEGEGESLDVALARVRRCICGGASLNDDSDSDLEVVSESVTVNLRCPMSGSRIKVAGRFKACTHMRCFDLQTFVELTQRTRKWQCPNCLKNYSLRDLVIDPFFTPIAKALESYNEDVTEVEMKPDGCWRPKIDGEAMSNEVWRSPSGVITMTNDANQLNSVSNPVKMEEDVLGEMFTLNPGPERAHDGLWKVNTHSGHGNYMLNDMLTDYTYEFLKSGTISSSSAVAISKEISSVNYEPLQLHKKLGQEDVEVDSCPVTAPANDPPYQFLVGLDNRGEAADIIILSDDEDGLTDPKINVERTCSFDSNLFEMQGINRDLDFQRIDYPEAPSIELGFQHRTVPLDFLGTGEGISTVPAQEELLQRERLHDPLSLWNSATECLVSQSSNHINWSMAMREQIPDLSVSASFGHAFKSKVTNTSAGGGCRISINGSLKQQRAVSDPSLREFLPHQPARHTATVSGQGHNIAMTDEMHGNWFSLSLGVDETLNAGTPLYSFCDSGTQIDPIVKPVSPILDLGHYGTQVNDSSFRGESTTSIAASECQRDYFSIDSSSA
ncbi:hypothetical protein KP509_1Z183600 [Ceratopteris richardii]|nr:hypothetical protein KP509_1Z183600 [Ceratopteris richardii]